MVKYEVEITFENDTLRFRVTTTEFEGSNEAEMYTAEALDEHTKEFTSRLKSIVKLAKGLKESV